MPKPPDGSFGPDEFAAATGVSRETLDRLKAFDDALVQWQKAVNLVSPNTLAQRWWRHFFDSWQLLGLAPREGLWLDLGSGGGFPGLVLAICRAGSAHALVESDLKKTLFLREAARLAGAEVTVIHRRIEEVRDVRAAVITARALAPVDQLLSWAAPFWQKGSVALFLKGQNVGSELTASPKSRSMRVEQFTSRTDPDGVILRVEEP